MVADGCGRWIRWIEQVLIEPGFCRQWSGSGTCDRWGGERSP